MPTISLAMIVKDELKTLEKTIDSILPYVDEVVIGLDEASSDGTEELLQKYPQYKVIRTTLTRDLAEKTGGFAKARNEVIAATSGDWVFMLDGHELLDLAPGTTLKQLVEAAEAQGYDALESKIWSEVYNGIPALIFNQARLFKQNIRYERENHGLPRAAKTLIIKEYKVLHLRQAQDPKACRERRKQADNTNEIGLKKELAKNPFDRRSIFYLGNTYKDRKEWENAVAQYERYIALGSNFKEELYHAHYCAALCYQAMHQADKAIPHAEKAVSILPQMAEAYYLLGEIYYYQKQYEQARVWLEKCCTLDIPDIRMFVYPLIYMTKRYDILSMVYHRLGMTEKARETVLKALANAPNDERFLRNLSHWSPSVVAPAITDPSTPSASAATANEQVGNAGSDGCAVHKDYKIHIIATGWNCAWNVDKFVASIKQQKGNWYLHMLDDGSTDGTADKLREYAGDRIFCYYEKENMGAALRRYQVIHPLEPDSIIITCGLDDALMPGAVERIQEEYTKGMWTTVSNCINQHGELPADWALNIPENIHKNREYRKKGGECIGSGCRSFYKWLFDKIPERDFMIDGKWEKTLTDRELMYSLYEMCGKEHTGVIREPTIFYNENLPNNSQKRFGLPYKIALKRIIMQRPKRAPVLYNPYEIYKPKLLTFDQQFFSLAPYLEKLNLFKISRNPLLSINNIFGYDIVFLDFCDQNAIFVTNQYAKHPEKAPKKVIIRCHRYEVHSRLINQIAWGVVTDIVFVSKYYKNLFITVMDPNKIKNVTLHVIHNGIDLDKFQLQTTFNPSPIGLVMRINAKKGPALLGAVAASFPELCFEVGGGFQDEAIKIYFEALHFPNLVFKGAVDSAEFLKGKKFLLSTSHTESFGVAIAEAMAMGLTPLIHWFPGAEDLWPKECLWKSFQDLDTLLHPTPETLAVNERYNPVWCRKWIEDRYSMETCINKILSVFGTPGTVSATSVIPKINRVTFELSTYCNYAKQHPRCPAHNENSVRTLAPETVYKVLEYLGKKEYRGAFSWHQYNEPLLDPRIGEFVKASKRYCPGSKSMIWTNGSCLDQTLMDEIESWGNDTLIVTTYQDKEKLESLHPKGKMKYQLFPVGWVEVLNVYDRHPNGLTIPCYAPLTDITITVDGKIGLCCRDYKHSVSFADLNTMSAEEAFTQPALLDAYERLSKGDRFLEICKRCTIYRDWRGGCDGVRYLPPGGTK